MAEAGIENKVAKSGLITIDLGDYAPEAELIEFDIKNWLYQGLILKEQDFKQYLKEQDWAQYEGLIVTVTCSTDAIIPLWAYMMVASKLTSYVERVYFGSRSEALNQVFLDNLKAVNPEEYQDAKIVIKGCGDKEIPSSAYVYLTNKLQPYVKTLMYGEPCSTVPVYKQPRKRKPTAEAQ